MRTGCVRTGQAVNEMTCLHLLKQAATGIMSSQPAIDVLSVEQSMGGGTPIDSIDALAASLAALSSSLLALSVCKPPLARSLAGAAHTVMCLPLQGATT